MNKLQKYLTEKKIARLQRRIKLWEERKTQINKWIKEDMKEIKRLMMKS